jgi:hypothetical protein
MLLPFALAVGLLARRAAPPRGLAWAAVGVNEAWVVASVVLLLGPWVAPSPLGVAFVLAQAAVVAVFAVLQGLTGGAAQESRWGLLRVGSPQSHPASLGCRQPEINPRCCVALMRCRKAWWKSLMWCLAVDNLGGANKSRPAEWVRPVCDIASAPNGS